MEKQQHLMQYLAFAIDPTIQCWGGVHVIFELLHSYEWPERTKAMIACIFTWL